jgi:diamine N-acetyltransferase
VIFGIACCLYFASIIKRIDVKWAIRFRASMLTLRCVRLLVTPFGLFAISMFRRSRQFVAPNAVSIAQAYFSREAWFRAIYVDEISVGFVMLKQVPEGGSCYLWRFMVDERYQKKGYGRRALQLVIEHVRSMPLADELTLSYHKGEGSPQPFYEKLGFRDTGRMINSEYEMKLKL